jgi:hypothetical protein
MVRRDVDDVRQVARLAHRVFDADSIRCYSIRCYWIRRYSTGCDLMIGSSGSVCVRFARNERASGPRPAGRANAARTPTLPSGRWVDASRGGVCTRGRADAVVLRRRSVPMERQGEE